MLREREIRGVSGWLMLFLLVPLIVLSAVMLGRAADDGQALAAIVSVVVLVVAGVCLFGLTVINPNQAKVVQLFGMYRGSLKQQGLRWGPPPYDATPRLAAYSQLREQ